MKEKELTEVVHVKNEIIIRQTRRICMLEEKFSDLRRKYLRLKYASEDMGVHFQQS
jgi:hypothetical protein